MRSRFLSLLALVALPAGCSFNDGFSVSLDPGKSVAMQDSFEITLFSKAQDDLHTPYVAGAKFDIDVATTDYPDTTGWRLSSSDSRVLSVNGQSGMSFHVTATGVGQATLTVRDGAGNVMEQQDVAVDQPDGVQLAAHGLLLAGYSDDQAQVTQASVVQGGVATFLVRYFKGSQELYGNGAVTPASTGAVTATTTTSSFADARDWLEVDAGQEAGSGQVALAVGGQTVATIPAVVVPSTAIASVGTAVQSDINAQDGNSLLIFARAFDAQGTDVYGGSFEWVAGGVAARPQAPGSGPSDVLSYTYKSGGAEIVTASIAGMSSSATVHGTIVNGVGGTVMSSQDTGCSVATAPGPASLAPGGALAVVALAGAATAARRRRRAADR
jgi:hypothetical protein